MSFQIPIGLDSSNLENGIDGCLIDARDIPIERWCVGQLKGRNLPVASARFLDQVVNSLFERYGHPR